MEKIQAAFDYAMENGVVLEVHELMEAFNAGYEDPADVLDFCCLKDCGVDFSDKEIHSMIKGE